MTHWICALLVMQHADLMKSVEVFKFTISPCPGMFRANIQNTFVHLCVR